MKTMDIQRNHKPKLTNFPIFEGKHGGIGLNKKGTQK